jgi:GNAT superfamily N-acetyltransferase
MATQLATAPDRVLESRHALSDGRCVQLALLGSADRADLLAGFARLSKRSRYLRFFSAMGDLPARIVDGLVATDPLDHVAIGARLVGANNCIEAPVVGVARYCRTAPGSDVAEPAVAVIDALHGQGLGRLLLTAIGRHARRNGIRRFRAHALADNERIRRILAASHGELIERDGPVVVYGVSIVPAQRSTR